MTVLVLVLLLVSAASFGAAVMLLCRRHQRVGDWSPLIGLACFVGSLVAMMVLAVFPVTTVSRTIDNGAPSEVDCGPLSGALNSPSTVDAFPRAERNPAATPCREAGLRRAELIVVVPLALGTVGLIAWFVTRRRGAPVPA